MPGVAHPLSQFDPVPLLTIFCLLLFVGLGLTVYFLVMRNEEFRELKSSFDKIMLSFNELDEQAKLIVKTDLELNKAQEELDRRLAGLNTLQKLAKKMSMTLDENELFQRIDASLVSELGFSRAFTGTYDENGKIIPRSYVGFDLKKIETLSKELGSDPNFRNALKNGLTFSSLGSSQKTRGFISHLFDTEHFVLSPLLTQRGVAGIIFFGNRYSATAVTEGDEELVAILASQIAQSLENSQLFEQIYRSSQTLEAKVNERTKELSHALKTVEEISKKKTEFISAVSHELRTPLTSIKGYASILMTGKVGDIPDAVKERLGKINTHSDNLVKLINDLLDISRIESGRVEMKTILQKVSPMVENIADLLAPQLQNKGVILKLNIPLDFPEIELDASQVERVFINLAGNAIKFTPAGGNITINAHFNRERAEAAFEVADTGIGIKKEDLLKVFDEFYRVDNEININVKGTGLGLALAKNIVEAHYGRMWVTSEVGIGTTFHFTLPIKHEPRETKKNQATDIGTMKQQKILIIDDDPDILDVLQLTLSDRFDVVAASNGAEGLKQAKLHQPDLIITDYMMPVMIGPEFCRELRKDVTMSHIPIIMLTGKGDIKDMVSGINAGADDYLIKPFEPESLLARINMIMKRTTRNLDANPLSHLPGNASIMDELQARIQSGQVFAVGYCDLDKFKLYNDKYGFEKGDEIIKATARIITQAAQEVGGANTFVGHIGGDDFVFVSDDNIADTISQKIIDMFDQVSPNFYSEQDRAAGFITGKDRQGNETRAGLLSISIGIVSNSVQKISHVAQIGEIGAELKKFAKAQDKSNYVRDKRRNADGSFS